MIHDIINYKERNKMPDMTERNFTDFDSIESALKEMDNVMTLKMGQLRDAHGVRKLGVNVLNTISQELANRGVGHYPEELPSYQNDLIRLYKLGTPVAELVKTLTSLDDKDSDDRLRQFAATDAESILKKVRDLVAPGPMR
jgi:hypothetical protein